MNILSAIREWRIKRYAKFISDSQNKFKQIQKEKQKDLNEVFLFDFKNYSSAYNFSSNSTVGTFMTNNDLDDNAMNSPQAELNRDVQGGTIAIRTGSNGEKKTIVTKIAMKPIDALNELETVPTPFSLAGIEEKITMLKIKKDLIVQSYSRKDVEGLIERLENRKKYNEYKSFFDGFQNTTDEKIAKLLESHELKMGASDLFIPEFPDIAITKMKEYTDHVKLICDKKPVFYVIAEPKDFAEKVERRDPILLVQSPFGFFWQILGAWDKEMLLLSEL